jgi:hypothetical protein
MESLSELNSSLKAAQSRISRISSNYSRLMRLVLDEELEILGREIAQVKNGSYEPLKMKYREALTQCEANQERARKRLVTVEHEIDTRFAAMVDAEWSQFNVLPDLGSANSSMINCHCARKCAKNFRRQYHSSNERTTKLEN